MEIFKMHFILLCSSFAAVYKKHREEEIQALKAKSDLERIKQEAAVEDDKVKRWTFH